MYGITVGSYSDLACNITMIHRQLNIGMTGGHRTKERVK